MADQKLGLLSFHSTWNNIVTKALDDYDSLTRDERIWYNVQCYAAQFNNGGPVDFYVNYGAEHYRETMEDLVTLGFDDIANMIAQMNALFPGGPSPDIEERNAVVSSWRDDDYELSDMLERLNVEFGARDEELEQALVRHILDRGLAVPDTPDTPGAYRPFRSKRPAQ